MKVARCLALSTHEAGQGRRRNVTGKPAPLRRSPLLAAALLDGFRRRYRLGTQKRGQFLDGGAQWGVAPWQWLADEGARPFRMDLQAGRLGAVAIRLHVHG